MKLKYYSKILLFFVLLFLLVGVISATDFNNDTLYNNMADENDFEVNDQLTNKPIKSSEDIDFSFHDNQSVNNDYDIGDKKQAYGEGYGNNTCSNLVKRDTDMLSDKRSEEDYTSSNNESLQFTTPVKHPVELHIHSIPNPCFGETIRLTGTLFVILDEGMVPVGNQIIRITVNNNHFSVVTDSAGGIDINYTVDTYNKSRVTFYYAGSNLHQSITNYTTMTVKQPTTLYIYPRSGDEKGSTIKVSGKLLSNDVGIKGQLIFVYVNGKRYSVGSGGYGYFTVNYTINSYDDLNITYDFGGSNKYAPCINSTIYTVLKPLNPTTLFMYSRTCDVMGSTIKVSGKLLTNTTPVKGGVISITVNDKIYSVVSDFNGYFTVNHTIDSLDDLNVTFSYGGNDSFSSCNNSTVYTVLKPMTTTNIFMYRRSNDAMGSTIKVSGKLQSNGEGVKGEVVSISVNGVNYTALTGGYGYFTVNHTIDSLDDLNVSFTYGGNAWYLPTSNSTVYIVVKSEKPTNLFIYSRADDIYGTTIKVSGKLQSNGEGVKGEVVIISVNGVNYTALTGGYGYFTVNHTITSFDDLNVTFTYSGRGTYLGCSNSTVYTILKQRYLTEIFMYQRSGDKFGRTIKVSGKLLCDGVGVKGEEMLIYINGENFTAKTGGYGYFTVNYTIKGYDDLNVIFTFRATGKYMGSSNSTVYTVLKNGQPTNIFMYERKGDSRGSTIKVSGKLQSNGVGIKGEIINIRVHNSFYTVVTGGNGYFTVNYTITNNIDDIYVNFTYNGSKKYLSSSNLTYYPLITTPSPTHIFMYTRSGDSFGSTIKVSGKLLRDNTPIGDGVISIIVNDKTYSAVSDFNGYFTVNHTIDSYDDLNVTFSYVGNFIFLASTNSTVYTVVKPKISTNLFMYSRSDDVVGNTIKVSGKLLCNGSGVKGETVTITVRGENFITKTVGYGYFTINYTITESDDLDVIFMYGGSDKYLPSNNSTVYAVKQLPTIMMYPRGAIEGNTIKFSGKLLFNSTPLSGEKISVSVNGKTFTTKTDSSGYFAIKYASDVYENHTVVCTFEGNSKYVACSNSTVYPLNQTPLMSIFSSTDYWVYGQVKNLRGRLYINYGLNTPIMNQNVTIVIGDENFTVVTDSTGDFSLNYTVCSVDKMQLIYKFDGNTFYNPINKTFMVEHVYRPTNIVIDPVKIPVSGSMVQINARIMSLDRPINSKRPQLSLKVNDVLVESSVCPDTGGYVTFNYTLDEYGTYDVEIEYKQYYPYLASTNSTTFTYVKT